MYIEIGKTQRLYFKSYIVLIEYSLFASPLSQYIHVHIYIYIYFFFFFQFYFLLQGWYYEYYHVTRGRWNQNLLLCCSGKNEN